MSLGFKRKPQAFWIGLDHKIFDTSELGDRPKSEREKISFEIYPLTRDLLRKTEQSNTQIEIENVIEGGQRKTEKKEIVDQDKQQEDLIDIIVKSWKGVIDMDTSEEISCTRENKLALLEGYPALGGCWLEAARKGMSQFDKFVNDEKEKTEKNSDPTSVGSGVGKKK